MNYLRFFLSNRKILLFGVLLTLYSSFGQTFILSLYIPGILESFEISSGFYSRLYALATLLSATTLIFFGKVIDHIPLKRFTLIVIFGIIIASLLAAFSFHVVMLFLAVYLLRFFGQGLLSHTSMTTLGRYFSRARGKALSIAYLGFPIGEGLMPIIMISIILWIGWRETFALSAVFILLTLLPLALWLIRGFQGKKVVEGPAKEASSERANLKEQRIWKQREIVRSPHFYLFAPTIFLMGFLQTAFFFFQTFIASFKGWSVEWMAASIVAYALSSFLVSMATGPLIDRFSARNIFPFTMGPMALGLLALSSFTHMAVAPFFWLMVGVSAGINTPLTNALYAETYGIRSLGAVRSIFTFVMVVSTALGPVAYSFFLERGFDFDQIHLAIIGVIILNAMLVFASSAIMQKWRKMRKPRD
ncbi:MAG: MFS transporter [Bacteroidales bacterium]|nr:MFS transporter [Bacteroidales bacterium]